MKFLKRFWKQIRFIASVDRGALLGFADRVGMALNIRNWMAHQVSDREFPGIA